MSLPDDHPLRRLIPNHPDQVWLDPFPHAVKTHGYDAAAPTIVDILTRAGDEFDLVPAAAWQRFRNDREWKDACRFDQVPERCTTLRGIADWLASDETCRALATAYGIDPDDLSFDPKGGGLHRIPVGGRLATHVDFNRSDDGRHRRVNVLIYLNRGWVAQPIDAGALVLYEHDGTTPAAVVPPEAGNCVSFATSRLSWHGHPIPTDRVRLSLAAYYFSSTPPPDVDEPHDTIFVS